MNLKPMIAAFALLGASASYAVSNNVTDTVTMSFDAGSSTWTGFIGAVHNVGSGSFADTFTINVLGDFNADSVLSTIGFNAANDIDFSVVTLNGNPYAPADIDGTPADLIEGMVLLPTPVSGPFTLIVTGTAGTNASYSGTLNLAPIPEPETYALMLAGLGVLGFLARRRRPLAS